MLGIGGNFLNLGGRRRGLSVIGGVAPERLRTTLLTGLASCWKLDDAAGSSRVDSHGIEHLALHGTVTQVAGKIGNAANFGNNVANYVSTATSANLETGDIDYTFNLWVNLTAKANSIDMFVSKWETGKTEYEIYYFLSSDRFAIDIGNGTSATPIATAIANSFGSPSTGEWHMITCGHDAANNKAWICVDGGQIDTVDTTGAAGSSSAEFRLGSRALSGRKCNGAVDEVLFWKRKLTQAEIAELYAAGAGNAYPFLGGDDLYSLVDTVDAGGQNIRLLIPNNHALYSSYPMVVSHHGNGRDETAITLADYIGMARNFVGNGYIVAASAEHGSNWGNAASLVDYTNLYNYVRSNYLLSGRIIHQGGSMGGLPSLLSIPNSQVPRMKGWLGNAPVCNLADMWASGAGTYAAAITAAYGLANDGEYAAKTAGHDPVLLDASTFDGLRMRFYASASDTVVSKVNNADAMRTLVTGHATELELVTCTGDHGDASHYQPVDMSSFCARCV